MIKKDHLFVSYPKGIAASHLCALQRQTYSLVIASTREAISSGLSPKEITALSAKARDDEHLKCR